MVENVIAPIIRKGQVGFKAIDAAVAVGLDGTNRFILPQDHSLNMTDVTFQAIGTFSAFTADIEVSLDGGVNFSVVAAIDFAATPAARNDLGRTGIYRLNVTAFVGTSADVIVAIP
jgi:hypothetical protein